MGSWCYDDNKGLHISARGKPSPPLTEVEKELYEFIKILEAQIERLDKKQPSKKDSKKSKKESKKSKKSSKKDSKKSKKSKK